MRVVHFDMRLNQLPRIPIAILPTAVTNLRRLSEQLGGPTLLIKRDDLNGLAFGGNKTRKLEFLVGEALAQGCDSVITGGAAQSNHCRQTAAAATAAGLECHLVLGGEEPDAITGNHLLDRLLGAVVHWSGQYRKGEQIPQIAEELRSQGKKPYVIPYGGSNAIGATGFVEAMSELATQLESAKQSLTHIVFASSSCGTQSGMAVGARLFLPDVKVVGIRIDKDETELPFEEQMVALANDTAKHIGAEMTFVESDFDIRDGYLGGGYGVVGDLERDAINLLARTEGILLDPVYTGRAFGAMIDLIKKGEFSKNDRVLFWHTGGTPALFSYASELT